MRMRKIVEAKERPTLEAAAKEFLAVKQAQMLSDETMHDYQAQLERFVCGSRNSTEYSLLEQDTLAFFAAIPDTSPARYNKPYQYISAFFNWMVRQEYIPKNPITANELKKRRDEGNIKPYWAEKIPISIDIPTFLRMSQLDLARALTENIVKNGYFQDIATGRNAAFMTGRSS